MSLLDKIQVFFGKQDLINAIKKTIELLENSEDSDWSNLTVIEIKITIIRLNKMSLISELIVSSYGRFARACYELLDMVNSENEPRTVSE